MANDEALRVWLSPETKAALVQAAAEDDRPISVYVRRLIERDLDLRVVPRTGAAKCRCGACEDRQDG
jgi:hypothetical protein